MYEGDRGAGGDCGGDKCYCGALVYFRTEKTVIEELIVKVESPAGLGSDKSAEEANIWQQPAK